MNEDKKAKPFMSPYLSGFGLGLTLLASLWLLGTGLGASGGLARCAAWLQHAVMPGHVEQSEYFGSWFGTGQHVMRYYLVTMGIGAFIGALISARKANRIDSCVERGPRSSKLMRLLLALFGGILVGWASRLARGCTSGQALTGTAMLFTGSVVFLVCLFAGAYIGGVFVRRQWL